MFSSRELRKIARDKLRGNWGKAILVTFLAGLLGGTGSGGSLFSYNFSSLERMNGAGLNNWLPGMDGFGQGMESTFSGLFTNPLFVYLGLGIASIAFTIGLAMLVVGACVELGHLQFYINLCNNRTDSVGVLFSKFNYFLKAVGLRLYIFLFVFLWSLLLIIPGIIAGYRYAMATYLMAQDPSKGIRECVDESKALMRGHKWRLFCLSLSFIGWSLLCVLTLGIGYLWLFPYVHAASAAFYLERTGQGIPLTPQPEPQA